MISFGVQSVAAVPSESAAAALEAAAQSTTNGAASGDLLQQLMGPAAMAPESLGLAEATLVARPAEGEEASDGLESAPGVVVPVTLLMVPVPPRLGEIAGARALPADLPTEGALTQEPTRASIHEPPRPPTQDPFASAPTRAAGDVRATNTPAMAPPTTEVPTTEELTVEEPTVEEPAASRASEAAEGPQPARPHAAAAAGPSALGPAASVEGRVVPTLAATVPAGEPAEAPVAAAQVPRELPSTTPIRQADRTGPEGDAVTLRLPHLVEGDGAAAEPVAHPNRVNAAMAAFHRNGAFEEPGGEPGTPVTLVGPAREPSSGAPVFVLPVEPRAAAPPMGPAAPAMPVSTLDPAFEAGLPRQIVQSIRLRAQNGGGEAHIRLKPDYLGELTVAVKVEQGVVTARLHAETPAVREWMEANEQGLRHSLAEQGLRLDRLTVTDQPPTAESDDRDRRRQSRQNGQSREEPRPRQGAGRTRTDGPAPTFEVLA